MGDKGVSRGGWGHPNTHWAQAVTSPRTPVLTGDDLTLAQLHLERVPAQ